ncbi:MAG: hypothetical protein EBU03_02840 [Methylophilaceae bacterium]|jgi:hypothetical protein|nr:hypothetical protein [Methylophilaceae bacterium]
MNQALKNQLIKAVQLIASDDWNGAHQIVQMYSDSTSRWIHAVLHKIEGDESNSRYWYARCNARFEDYADIKQELEAIRDFLI